MDRARSNPAPVSLRPRAAGSAGQPPHPRPDLRVRLVVLPPVTEALWRCIDTARASPDPRRRRAAHDAIARRYLNPVRRVLLALGARPQDVPDLADEFLGLVLPARILPAADPQRGSFNGLLLTALRRHLAERRRAEHRRAQIMERYARDPHTPHATHAPYARDPGRESEAQRERAAVHKALRAAQEHFIATGRREHWRAFALFVLVPLAVGANRPSHTQIAAALAAARRRTTQGPGTEGTGRTREEAQPPSAQRVAVMIRTVRARVRHELSQSAEDAGFGAMSA